MTRPTLPSILSELRNASSPASQVVALQALKHDIIGHEQKKKLWINHGVLAPIARILSTHKANGKRKHRDTHNSRAQSKQRGARSDEEEARLQAIIIVGTLAHGGPAFIPPIHASSILRPLLSLLSPGEAAPQLILAALRSLNAVADSLLLCHVKDDGSQEGLLALLYAEQSLANLTHLLLQTSVSWVVHQQLDLTATLIHKTCHEEHHRSLLAQAGILEALAFRVASFIVATGCASNTNNHTYQNTSSPDPDIPAHPGSTISIILQTISAITLHSQTRATQFLYAPALNFVFQRPPDANTHENKGSSWEISASAKLTPNRTPTHPLEQLLPSLPKSHSRGSLHLTSGFPPLGTLGSSRKQPQPSRSFSSAIEVNQSQGLELIEQEESPLISWLIFLVRNEDEVTGLTAAFLLAILYRQGLAKRAKELAFALLLVPTLSRMLDKDLKICSMATFNYEVGMMRSPERLIKEQAPAVLAMLAANSLEIQKSAVDAGVIKKLSQLLKESYDEIPLSSSASLWTAEKTPIGQTDVGDGMSRLGADGLSPAAWHVVRLRESVLIALAAIASDKDEYRKAIIENGVIPFIIKTLKPEGSDPSSATQDSMPNEGISPSTSSVITENPKEAIIAACGAATALSRSVSILRTSLMDSGLTAPLFVLLKHQDIDLQIAATAVVCNLVLQFSPMQEAIIEAGALKILCEHAHSANNNLRLNSVWALKHLILQASNELKMSCLEELGPGWLKQIVKNDVEIAYQLPSTRGEKEEGSGTPIRMSTPNAAGEQVDLLNAVDNNSRASSQDGEDGGDDLKMADSIGALSRGELDGKRSTLRPYRDIDHGVNSETTNYSAGQRPSSQGMSDELAIQKEGLDLLRNLLCGSGAADMIDFVFRELGQDKLFEMLAAKLRPRITNAFDRERRASENGVRHSMPHMEIVLSICYIIVHIAAGDTRQRQLLIAQTELLRLIIPLFSHPDAEIRSCCVWVCINLTWIDSESDKVNCKARARELTKLGVYEKLEQLENDPVSDVRERAKTALSLGRS